MNKVKTHKRIWSLLLTLAMVFTMTVAALPAYAAAGGNISVVYNPGVEGLTSTNFKLYKVADYGRDADGTSKVVLEDWASGSGVDLNIAVPEDEEDKSEGSDWNIKWLKAASSLANWMETSGAEEAAKHVVIEKSLEAKEESQTLGPVSDGGIYILIGEESKVNDKFWQPVPVLIQVLNGDVTFDISNATLKMTSKSAVYKHSIKKSWVGDKEAARPESIRVGLFYGTGNQIDTVTLSKSNDYTYEWYTKEKVTKNYDGTETVTVTYTNKDPKDEDSKGVETEKLNPNNNYLMKFTATASSWKVEEMRKTAEDMEALRYYTSEVTNTVQDTNEDSDGLSEFFNITNTFKTAELKITKDLKSYVSQGDANTMVVFDIEGKIGDNVVYKNSVGMAFTGKGTQTFTVDNIPYNLDSLTVKEVYSTNYKATSPAGGKTTITDPVISEDGTKTYEVSFTNEYEKIENPPTYNSGIVNEYNKSGKNYEYQQKTETSSNTNANSGNSDSGDSGSGNGSQE